MNIILYMRVRGHANAWSQMKPSGMKPSRMDAAGFEPEETAGGQNKFNMKKHGSCVQSDYQSKPNSS